MKKVRIAVLVSGGGTNLQALIDAQGSVLTSGGRVTGTTAVSSSLEEAIAAAYRLSAGVKLKNAYSRSDIGQRALAAKK